MPTSFDINIWTNKAGIEPSMHVREAQAPAGEVNDCNDADLLDYRLSGWLLRRFKGRTGMTWIICPSLF